MFSSLSKVDWIYVALIVLGARALIDASLAQAIIVAVFGGLKAYSDYLKATKVKEEYKNINEEVTKQLDHMKTVISGLSMKSAVNQHHNETRRYF